MKKEATDRIRAVLTPEVTIEACHDVAGGIIATVKHEYFLGFPMVKVINVKADEEGNVLEAVGLF